MTIKHIKTKDNIAEILITVPSKTIDTNTKTTLSKLSQTLSVKGFRKGKVPPAIAKKEIGEEKLKQKTIDTILESAIIQIIKDKKFELLGIPQLQKADTDKKESWSFTLKLPLNPKIQLGDYKKTIHNALAKSKKNNKDTKFSLIIDTLLKKIKIIIPNLLIEREVENSLARLVRQTETLNLSLETYLASIKKTPQQIRDEYQKKAEENIKIDLILSKIANDLKITATTKEIETFAQASNLSTQHSHSIASIIVRRKTLDQLLTI